MHESIIYLALPTRAGSPQQHMPITVGPLFSGGLNSKYLTPVMYFELSPQRKWVWHGRGWGLTQKGVVGA